MAETPLSPEQASPKEAWKPIQKLYTDITTVLAKQTEETGRVAPQGFKRDRACALPVQTGAPLYVTDQLTWAHREYPDNHNDFGSLPPDTQQRILDQPLITVVVPLKVHKQFEIYGCDPWTLDSNNMYRRLLEPLSAANAEYMMAREEYLKDNPQKECFPGFFVLEGPQPRMLGPHDGHVLMLSEAVKGYTKP